MGVFNKPVFVWLTPCKADKFTTLVLFLFACHFFFVQLGCKADKITTKGVFSRLSLKFFAVLHQEIIERRL